MNWKNLLSESTLINRENEPSIWNENYPINFFEKDYKAIISSAAFRRLQDKTQVFPLDKSDFVRTRLTHSIEVSTIGKQLGVMVTHNNKSDSIDDLNDDDVRTNIPTILACAGLLHDLGNPPFGHFGEVVIGNWFKNILFNENSGKSFMYKGEPIYKIIDENSENENIKQMYNDLCNFEGNAQALRILSKINSKPDGYELNLSYAIINSLIKYPCSSLEFDKNSDDIKLHKFGYYLSEKEVFDKICVDTGTKDDKKDDNIIYRRHPLTFLLEAADDIAYATSDLEDAVKKGIINIEQFIAFFDEKLKLYPEGAKRDKSQELIDDLKKRLQKLDEQNIRNHENEIVEFQKWSIYVKGWLMYVVAYSFTKNYNEIISGEYEYDLFKVGFHEYSIKILKDAMIKYVFDYYEIVKLELSANKIISSLLSDFIKAVIHWDIQDKQDKQDKQYKPSKTDMKLINIISDNLKQNYKNSKTDDETFNLYLRFLMVTDFISGMTDSFAKTLYQELNGIV